MRKLFVVIAVLVMAAQLFITPSFIGGPSSVYARPDDDFDPCVCLSTLEATDVGINSATLNGQVGGQPSCLFAERVEVNTQVNILAVDDGPENECGLYFVYGTDPNHLSTETKIQLGTSNGKISYPVTGLKPCTKYYYQVVAVPCVAGILSSPDSNADYNISAYGAGIGLKPVYPSVVLNQDFDLICYGEKMSFTTLGCELLDDSDLPGSSGGGTAGTPADQKGLRPYIQMSAIAVKSATISNPSVGPGQPVVVKANVTNSGTGNGVARITVYINGVEESAQPATLTSGQSSTLEFTVTRNEPGTYSVVVNNVPAGSFTVGLFNGNDMLIYGSIALVAIGFGGVLYMLTRKRNTA